MTGKADLNERFDSLMRSVKEGYDRFVVWFDRAETQAAFNSLLSAPDAILERMQLQRKFFKAGFLPAGPLEDYADGLHSMSSVQVGNILADALDQKGFVPDAISLREITAVASLGNSAHTLRVIFPEIESIARRYLYSPEIGEPIASLIEMRLRIADLQMDAPLHAAIDMMLVEKFIFVNLAAIEFTYARSNENPSHKFRRVFAKVANRHLVCHGFVGCYDDQHVINALTLLYISVIACHSLVGMGLGGALVDRKAGPRLVEKREQQKELNRSTMVLLGKLKWRKR